MRNTLAKYYSYSVKIEGVYKGPAKGHLKAIPINPRSGVPENALIKGLVKEIPDMLNYDDNTKLLDISETSLLINVRGLGQFADIKEDHVIIQGRIDANIGDTVILQCSIDRYNRADGSYDYGILLLPPEVKNTN